MDTNKQMEFLFEEGGIADDGMDRDPISGNEVPPGSIAEEVRDDIPAQLSEGEYVVPADVVRYYGVKFFEDLRSQAKMGLGEMERNGRIGGEPIMMEDSIEPGEESELSPEEMAELESIMGMAVGGVVGEPYSAPVAASRNPTNPDAQMYDPMAQQGLYNKPRGFAPGGDVQSVEDLTFSQTQATLPPGFGNLSFLSPSEPAAQEEEEITRFVTLYSPDGRNEVVSIPQNQDRYDELIAEGWSEEPFPQQQEEATQERDERDPFDGMTLGDRMDAERPVSELTTDELKAQLAGVNTIGKVASGLMGVFNPLVGIGAAAGLRQSRNAIIQELESRGEDLSDVRAEYGKDLYGGGMSLFDGLQNQEGSREGVGFDDTWLGDLLGFDGKAGVQGPDLKDSRDGARRSFESTTATSARPTAAQPERSLAARNAEASLRELTGSAAAYAQDQINRGYTGSSVRGIAVGQIAGDGQTAGVVANDDGTVVRDENNRTVFRDEDGRDYVKTGILGQNREYKDEQEDE